MSFKFRPIKYPPARVPQITFVPGDQQLNAYRIAERNLSRRELVVVDEFASSTLISGSPINGREAPIPPNGSGLALDTTNFGQSIGPPPLTLLRYFGEIYALGVFAPPTVHLGELVDTSQQDRDNVIPATFFTRFFGTGSLPVQGPSSAPVKVLEPDPNGLRIFVALYLSFGAVFLSTSAAPGDQRSLFQYGQTGGGGVVREPLVWTAPYVPRSGLFATGDAGGHRLFAVEGFGR